MTYTPYIAQYSWTDDFQPAQERLDAIASAITDWRKKGLLATEEEGGLPVAAACEWIGSFANGYKHLKIVLAPGGPETRAEVRKQLENLIEWLEKLESAATQVQTLLGDEIYSGLSETTFRLICSTAVERGAMIDVPAGDSRVQLPDPLQWIGGGLQSLRLTATWAAIQLITVRRAREHLSQPGRDLGTPDAGFCDQLRGLWLDLDHREGEVIKPPPSKALREWFELAYAAAEEAPGRDLKVAANEARALLVQANKVGAIYPPQAESFEFRD